jgi:hypothetical protein
MVDRPIPEAVAEFARAELGRDLEFSFAGWPHTDSRIWRAARPDKAAFYVKHHDEPYLFARHLYACQHWAPKLPVRVPELIAASDAELRTMIFSEVPGSPLELEPLPPDLELDVYREAGSAARVLHALGCDAEPSFDAAEYVSSTFHDYCEKARGLIEGATLRWAMDALGDASSFRGQRRVPCHRDYSPRNWLVQASDDRAELCLIDFERARLDLSLYEFQRMWPDHWRRRPDRQRAFFEGYGTQLSPEDEHNLKLLVLRTSINTLSWATAHGDPAFARQAAETIEYVRGRL